MVVSVCVYQSRCEIDWLQEGWGRDWKSSSNLHSFYSFPVTHSSLSCVTLFRGCLRLIACQRLLNPITYRKNDLVKVWTCVQYVQLGPFCLHLTNYVTEEKTTLQVISISSMSIVRVCICSKAHLFLNEPSLLERKKAASATIACSHFCTQTDLIWASTSCHRSEEGLQLKKKKKVGRFCFSSSFSSFSLTASAAPLLL